MKFFTFEFQRKSIPETSPPMLFRDDEPLSFYQAYLQDADIYNKWLDRDGARVLSEFDEDMNIVLIFEFIFKM